MGALDALWPFRPRRPASNKPASSHARSSRPSEKNRKKAKDVAERGQEKKPDIEELRLRRNEYYRVPPEQRRRAPAAVSTSTTSRSKPKVSVSSRSSTARKAAGKSSSRHARTGGMRARTPITISEDNVEDRGRDYVYDGTSFRRATDPQRRGVLGSSNVGNEGRNPNQASARRRDSIILPEAELTPDDSVSQVGGRAYRSRPRQTTRPSLGRSKTTTDKLSSTTSSRRLSSPAAAVPSTRSRNAEPSTRTPKPRRNSTLSSIPVEPAPQQPPELVDCLTCGADDTPIAQSALLECEHRMCQPCLRRIFTLSMTDPATHMPPRCCNPSKHIPLKHVDSLFDTDFKKKWNRKYLEMNTKNAVYCPNKQCGEWIRPKQLSNTHEARNDKGRRYRFIACPYCKANLCASCKGPSHPKTKSCRSASSDADIAALFDTAQRNGWQRCHNCRTFVEKKEGCNHMTCRCKAEFCMLCGAKWKTCQCPWFDQREAAQQNNNPRQRQYQRHHFWAEADDVVEVFDGYDDLPDRLNGMRVPQDVQEVFEQLLQLAGGDGRRVDAAGDDALAQRHRGRQRPRQRGRLDDHFAAAFGGAEGVAHAADGVAGAADGFAGAAAAGGGGAAAPPHAQREPMTYQQELAARRRQEREDAALARQLQFASLIDRDSEDGIGFDDLAAAGTPPFPRRPIRRRHRDAIVPPVAETAAEEPAEAAEAEEDGVAIWGFGNARRHFLNEDFVQNAADVVVEVFDDPGFGRRGERASGRRRRRSRARAGETGHHQAGGEGEDAGLVPDFLGDESVLHGLAPVPFGASAARSARSR